MNSLLRANRPPIYLSIHCLLENLFESEKDKMFNQVCDSWCLVPSFHSNYLIEFRAKGISSKLSNFSKNRKRVRKYEEIDPLSSGAQWNKFAMARQGKPRTIRREGIFGLKEMYWLLLIAIPSIISIDRNNYSHIFVWSQGEKYMMTDVFWQTGIAGNNTGEIQGFYFKDGMLFSRSRRIVKT